MQLKVNIDWSQKCTWRLRLTIYSDALEPLMQPEMHRETVIGQGWGCGWGLGWNELRIHIEFWIVTIWRGNWRVWLHKYGDAHEGHKPLNLEINLKAMMMQVWRCTKMQSWTPRCSWRIWTSECADALGGQDQVSWKMPWEAKFQWNWGIGKTSGSRLDGTMCAEAVFTDKLAFINGTIMHWLDIPAFIESWLVVIKLSKEMPEGEAPFKDQLILWEWRETVYLGLMVYLVSAVLLICYT